MKFLKNLFRKSPATVLEELKTQENALNQRRVELELESRQAKQKLNQAIASAAKCQREGDGIGRKEATTMIAVERSEAQHISRDRLMNIKTLSVVRIASRKITTLLRDNKASAVHKVVEIMSSKQVQEIVAKHDIEQEECERKIEALFNINFEQSKSSVSPLELASEDETLIEDLVKAQEAGDEQEVARIQAKLQGADDITI